MQKPSYQDPAQWGGTPIILTPIGTIRTPFRDSVGMPIQSSFASGVEGVIELFPQLLQGLHDLDGFERLWVMYYFHRAVAPKLMVSPYLDPVEHGIFATRSPARPNKIGMSPVRLLGIDGPRLRIADVDMLDGTPLLDIKPYLPAFDHFEVVRTGWYKDTTMQVVADSRFELKTPQSKVK
ncbi:MAG: tRNA (N6-threonylcarbamoyladenosine(37)-N6)-methyltransferase TrmO [Acidobacteriaceae bacterium]